MKSSNNEEARAHKDIFTKFVAKKEHILDSSARYMRYIIHIESTKK